MVKQSQNHRNMKYFRSEDSHKHWEHLLAPLRTNPKTRESSIISLTSDRLCAVTTFQESMFQWLTMLSVKNLFLKTNLNFPFSSFILLKQLWFPERGSQHLPLHCSTTVGCPSAFLSPRCTSQVTSMLLSCLVLESFHPQLGQPSLSIFQSLMFIRRGAQNWHKIWGEATPVQCTVGQSHSLTSQWFCAWCTPRNGWSFWLPRDTADSCSTCHKSRSQSLFLLGFPVSYPQVYTYAQDFSQMQNPALALVKFLMVHDCPPL